jgi:hypothetical protein
MEGQRLGVRIDPPRWARTRRNCWAASVIVRKKSPCCARRRQSPERSLIFINEKRQIIMTHAGRQSAIRGIRILIAAAAFAMLASGVAQAQMGERAIKLVLPVASASGVDTITRAAQPALAQDARASGRRREPAGRRRHPRNVAAGQSAPDGNTLSVVSNNHVIYPSVYKSVPFDPITTSRRSP